jgi:ligand-binding sensor domain-containing protein
MAAVTENSTGAIGFAWVRRKAIFCAGLLLVAVRPLLSLDPDRALTQFGLDVWQRRQGLPQSSVTAIVQTRDGYLWLGTEEGLARFDGVRFTVFDRKNTPELERHNVTVLTEGHDGALWIGTLGGGLIRYAGGRFRRYGSKEGLPDEIVSALAEDHQGTLWVGTFRSGVARLHGDRFELLTTKDGLSNNEVRAVFESPDGAVWIGTRGGGVNRWSDRRFTAWTSKEGLSNDQVTAICGDGVGGVWIATRNGLNRMAGGKIVKYTKKDGLSSDAAVALHLDRDGSLWIGTVDGGLQRFRDGRFETLSAKTGLSNDTVLSLSEDAEGDLWAGTSGGLVRLRQGPFIPWGVREGLSSDEARPVFEDVDGDVWIGTVGGGLNRIHRGVLTVFTARDGLLSDRVWAIHQDRAGALWVGTREGLNRYHRGRWTGWTIKDGLPNNLVLSIAGDAEDNLWIGTAGGLARFRDGRFSTYGTKDGLSNDRICAIVPAPDGSLWLATMGGGVNRIVAGKILPGPPGPLDRLFIYDILPDKDGAVWIATAGQGLHRWKDGRWSVATTHVGLFDDVVFRILDDGRGNLWMSSNRGVFRVAKQDLDRFAEGKARSVVSRAYDESDGMRESECNGAFQPAGWRARDGRLWFPTVRGAVVVAPEKALQESPPPQVAVEEITVDGERVPVDAPARFPPGKTRFEFRYTALALRSPETVHFRFRLEGFDRNWIEAGTRRTAYYTNVPPDSYRFRVQTRSGDGPWSENGAVFAFALAPHFYRTGWFAALIAAALAVAAAAVHRARLASARLQTELAAARLTALKAQLQPHFLFNTLNMILPLTYRDPDTASRMLVLLGDLLRASLERDATTLVPLREELEFLQKYLEIQRARFAERLEVRFEVDEDVLDAPIPSLLLQPLVENAIKHGISKHRGEGRIDISCRRDHGFLALTVWNTAGGDTEGPADHSHGIGLSNIQERLDLIYGGAYRFSREASREGFRVIIRLPLETSAPTANGAEGRRPRETGGTPAPASGRA